MKSIIHLLFSILSNAIALIAAAYFVPGFFLVKSAAAILVAALLFTGLNLVIKPILKVFFGPFILISLGIFLIIINALLLKILDFFSPQLTIEGYLPLLYATIIISVVNFVLTIIGRPFYKND